MPGFSPSFSAGTSSFAHSPAALDRNRYERFAAFLAKEGLIPKALPVGEYAVEVR